MNSAKDGISRPHLYIDEEGEPWEATAEEFEGWARKFQTEAGASIAAVADSGLIHLWRAGKDLIVSLVPEKVSAVTVTGAAQEIARLDQDWTIVASLKPGGNLRAFRGRSAAINYLVQIVSEAQQLIPVRSTRNSDCVRNANLVEADS